MKISHDAWGRNEASKVYLATPDKMILCALNSIRYDECSFDGKCNDISTLTLEINQYVERDDGKRIEANGYNLVSKFMKLYVTNIGWFIMNAPETHHTGTQEYKTITANSAQIEYNQIPLEDWKVNRGTTDSLEMLVDGNVEEIEGVEFAKENIKFYNSDNSKLSLIDILVAKVPGWKIGYIDNIPKIYESIENGETISKQVLLADEVGTFDISQKDCYSFMVQDFEKYFNCIVDFDFLNYEVNFYRVENYGKDTSIVIGFRNVENTNDISIDEDNIYTKFRVTGGDNLGIEQFNGGSNYLIYLSDYWLNQKYLSASAITKYQNWVQFCYEARYQYGDYSKQWNTLQEEISELNNRVPVSDCNPENWENISDEELLNLKSDYEAQKLGYEKLYVDEDGDFDLDALNASPDANTYHQIVDTILPNINIEIDNRNLPTSEGEKDFIEDYQTNWDYYGVSELAIKLQSYQDLVNLLKKSHYDLTWERYKELSSQDSKTYPPLTQDGFEDKHNEYLKNATQLEENNPDTCAYALKQRKAEVEAKESEQKTISDARNELANKMNIETWQGQISLTDEASSGFTPKELREINHIIKQTTYSNENIFVSSTENLTDTVLMQQKLCEAALDDADIYSTPQAIYTTTLDNILALIKDEARVNTLQYGNFIRLGLRDDYYVKLRVSGISFNPFLYDNNFTIQFSNMIKSGKKRNDFVSLLDLAGNLSSSSISNTQSGNNQISDDNIYQILQAILNSSRFHNKVENIINNSSGNGDNYLSPGDIYGNNAFFEYIQAELITAGKIVAEDADFKKLKAFVAEIDNLLAGNVSAELGHIISLTADNVKIDEAVIRDLIAAQITVSMLKASDISADKFNIRSDDGALTIIGNTMQFRDKNGNIRIQIGRDANDDFTFVLYDETGQGVLIDSTGIKDSAIADGLIKNDMIADGTITENKINKSNIREWTDAEGNKLFDVSKMYFGDELFEVSYTQMKETVKELGESISENTPYNIILENEYQNIPCIDGYIKEDFLIEISFSGYVGTKQSPTTAMVGLLPSGMTLGGNTPSTDSEAGKIILNIAKNSDFGGTNILTGYIILTFTINEHEITKRFTWSKTNDGNSGDASFYVLDASNQLITKNDKSFSPESLTFHAYLKQGTRKSDYLGRFIVKESNGTEYETKYLSEQNESTISYTPSSTDVKSIQCTLCEADKITSELDVKTIPVIVDAEYIQSEITEITQTVSEIGIQVDKNTQEISQKASKTDITTAINNYDGSTVKTIRDQLSQVNISLGQISSTVSDVQTSLDQKADGSTVHELTEKVSSMEQDLSSFKIQVSETYVTNTDLENLDLGATNLLTGTQWWDDLLQEETDNIIKETDYAYLRCYKQDTYYFKKFDVSELDKITVSFDARTDLGNISAIYDSDSNKLYAYINGNYYELYRDSIAKWSIEFYFGNELKETKDYIFSIKKSDSWERFFSVVEIPDDVDNIVIKIEGKDNTTDYVDYCKFKIIDGIGDNHWTLSSDDLENRFSRNEAEIKLTKDAIESKVWSEDIQRQISNIKIGAVNLVTDSGNYDETEIEKLTWVALNEADWKFEITSNILKITKLTTSNTAWVLIPITETLRNKESYILTTYLKSNKSKTINIYAVVSEGQGVTSNEKLGTLNTTTTTQRFQLTHTMGDSGYSFIAFKGSEFSKNDYLEITNIMFEHGTIPSDWRENETDFKIKIDTTIEKVNETIQNLDGTLSTVQQKVDSAVQSDEMDGYLEGLVDNESLKEQLEAIKNSFNSSFATQTQLQQTANSLTTSIQMAGGYNMIKNSIGLGVTKNNTMTNWTYINTDNIKVYAVQGTSFAVYGGESEIVIQSIKTAGGSIYQDITTTSGLTYTIALHINPTLATGFKLKVTDVTSKKVISDNLFNSAQIKINNYNYFYTQIKAQGNLTRIQFEVTGTTLIHIAGLRLVIGTNPLQWTLSSGESYSANVRMDVEGITVYRRDNASSFTRMSPDEFAIYDNNERIAWAASDEFHMKKAVIENAVVLGNILMQTVTDTKLTKNRRGVLFISQSV